MWLTILCYNEYCYDYPCTRTFGSISAYLLQINSLVLNFYKYSTIKYAKEGWCQFTFQPPFHDDDVLCNPWLYFIAKV